MKSQIANHKSQISTKSKILNFRSFGHWNLFGNWKLEIGNSQSGFTLIEAVVSAGVFAIAATSIVGIYTSIQGLNSRSTAIEAVQQNIRFINEDLAKIISNGSIDYASYSGLVPQPQAANLYLTAKDGTKIRVYQTGSNLTIVKTPPLGGPAASAVYTGSDVRVLDFRVYITPAANPFPPSLSTPKEQPTVTIYVEFEANLGARDPVRQYYQTTIATKEYPEGI